MPNDELLTVAEVASQLRVGQETVRRWLRSKKMHGVAIGIRSAWRIPASEIERFHREGPRP